MISLSTKLEFKLEFVRIFKKFSAVKIYNDLNTRGNLVHRVKALMDILVDSTEVELR